MQYTDVVDALGYYCQQYVNPAPEWTPSLPTIIDNAELRIYRELDFLAMRGQNASLAFTAGSRTLSMGPMTATLSSGDQLLNAYPVVVQGVAAILPPNDAPKAGTRVRFVLTSVDFIDIAWPEESVTQAPATGLAYYAMLDHQTIIVAPTPDQAYTAEITGTWRPAPLSSTNPSNWLWSNLPDLAFKAAMVEAAGWLRDFGQQSDDPKMAQSWENQYQAAKVNAVEEEQRRKGADPGWQPFQPAPLSGTPRQ